MNSEVALSHGLNRIQNIEQSLRQIDDAVRDAVQEKDEVLLKPNFVSSTTQLASTHVDAAESVIEFFESLGVTKFTIAESSADDTNEAFRNFGFHCLERDHDVELVDLNAGSYREIPIDYEPYPISVRVAEPLLDDSSFLVSLARLKTHDTVVATLSLNNLLMGSMLKTDEFNDKSWMHWSTITIERE